MDQAAPDYYDSILPVSTVCTDVKVGQQEGLAVLKLGSWSQRAEAHSCLFQKRPL